MVGKLPMLLTFVSGIATGAFTNVFTGLEREHLAWRVAAMVAFAASAAIFFASAIRAESALGRARLLSGGAGDLRERFRNEFGKAGWTVVAFAATTGVAAVGLLLFATVLQEPNLRP